MSEFEHQRVSVTAQTMPDGTITYPVPSELPEAHRLVFCRANADTPSAPLDVVMTLPRALVEDYAGFLSDCGTIDRSPTPEEITVIMQLIANHLAKEQIAIMERVTNLLIERLSDGDHEAAAERTLDAVTDTFLRQAIATGRLTAEEAEAKRGDVRAMLNNIGYGFGKGSEKDGEKGGTE